MRVAAILDRIAADIDELAWARRLQDLTTAAVLPDRRTGRRRRLAEPDLEFRALCTPAAAARSPAPQLERAWDAGPAGRYQRGEISQRPGYADNRSVRANANGHPCRSAHQGRSGNWTP